MSVQEFTRADFPEARAFLRPVFPRLSVPVFPRRLAAPAEQEARAAEAVVEEPAAAGEAAGEERDKVKLSKTSIRTPI